MSYRDLAQEAILRERQDAEIFAAVGLGWLSRNCLRRAERLESERARAKSDAAQLASARA